MPDAQKNPRRTAPLAILAAAAALFALTGFGSGERLFAPSASLWERWTAHVAGAARTVDHAAWDRFLSAYLVVDPAGPNRMRYGAVSAPDRRALDGYIQALARLPISQFARPEQMAYWINLYNALTVRVVLDHYPVASIRDIDISPGLFADGPWDARLVTVEGAPLTLNDIEHRILRPIWRDARVHYAVNCASLGCPDLAREAYRGQGLDARLEAAASAYVNDPRGVSIRSGRAVVSKLYDWFIEDFGRTPAAIKRHLLRYADAELKADLTRAGDLDDVQYDWRLNDAAD